MHLLTKMYNVGGRIMSLENHMVVGFDEFDIDVSDIEECESCQRYIGNESKIEEWELDKCTCVEEE